MTLPGAVVDRAGPDPGRPRRRRALHEEELAGGAVRIALHHHRAIAEVRQQHGGDVGVVLEQVALGEPELRPEELAEVGEPDLLPSTVRTTLSSSRGMTEAITAAIAVTSCIPERRQLRRALRRAATAPATGT